MAFAAPLRKRGLLNELKEQGKRIEKLSMREQQL